MYKLPKEEMYFWEFKFKLFVSDLHILNTVQYSFTRGKSFESVSKHIQLFI